MIQLTCGCCGTWFLGEADPQHDVGFGTCAKCTEWIRRRDVKEIDRLLAKLSAALNPKNRVKFEAMDRKLQEAFLAQTLEDGMWSFAIGRNGA